MQNKKYVRLEPFFNIGNFGVQEIVSGGAAVRACVCECVNGVCRMCVVVRVVLSLNSNTITTYCVVIMLGYSA